jgi:hypothetical protein
LRLEADVPEEKKRVHAACMLTDKGGRVWVLFDEERTLRGRRDESCKDLLRRWQHAHGKVDVLVRILGMCRPSELAMQIADLQRRRRRPSARPLHSSTMTPLLTATSASP